MNLELTNDQLKVLYQLVIQSNWNGQQIEIAYELKQLLGKEIEDQLKKENE